MAKTTIKRMREADQIVDQNLAQEPAVPATPAEVDQAVQQPAQPVQDQPVAADAGQDIIEPAVDEAPAIPEGTPEIPAGESPVKVNPSTVGVEVQIPTDQLAAAVAMATGDVEAAEAAPDAEAQKAEEELVAEAPAEDTSDDVPVEDAQEAPADDLGQAPVDQAPVMESRRRPRVNEGMDDGKDGAKVAKERADQIEDIIETGVKNTAKGLSNGKDTLDKKKSQNLKDIIDTGVKNTAKGLKEAKEEEELDEDPIKDSGIDEECKDGECDGEKLDFSKLKTEDGPELPEGLGEDDELGEIDDDVFDGQSDKQTDEFLANISNFLRKNDTEEVTDALRTTADFIDAIEPDQDDEEIEDDEVFARDVEEPEDGEEEALDFDDLISGAYDEEPEEEDDFDEDEEPVKESRRPMGRRMKEHTSPKDIVYDRVCAALTDYETKDDVENPCHDYSCSDWCDEFYDRLADCVPYVSGVPGLFDEISDILAEYNESFDEDNVCDFAERMYDLLVDASNALYDNVGGHSKTSDPVNESVRRVPCRFPKKTNGIRESRKAVGRISESESGIIYPAGSEPEQPLVERRQNLVEAHDRFIQARREAVSKYRESIRKANEAPVARNARFNEALRSSVRFTEKDRNEKSWNNNRFDEKYSENNRLDFKKLLG